MKRNVDDLVRDYTTLLMRKRAQYRTRNRRNRYVHHPSVQINNCDWHIHNATVLRKLDGSRKTILTKWSIKIATAYVGTKLRNHVLPKRIYLVRGFFRCPLTFILAFEMLKHVLDGLKCRHFYFEGCRKGKWEAVKKKAETVLEILRGHENLTMLCQHGGLWPKFLEETHAYQECLSVDIV